MTSRSAALALVIACFWGMTIASNNSAIAAGEKVGDTQMCVPLQSISETRVIDEQTILIEMHGRKYKRMDLVAPCSGLTMGYGWVHHTHTNDICTTDILRVNQVAGATCMIKQIVSIGADEAKALQKKKNDRRNHERGN